MFDEEALARDLPKLIPCTRAGNVHPFWHLLVRVDPDEMLDVRRKQKMQLARYARLGAAGPGLGWDDVEVTELRRLYEVLGEVLDGEGAAAGLEGGG